MNANVEPVPTRTDALRTLPADDSIASRRKMIRAISSINGLYFVWRTGATCDALRAFVSKGREKPLAISAKLHPTLKEINRLLKARKLRAAQADQDPEFLKLKQRLEHELKSEYGLKAYTAMKRVDLKTRAFDFEQSLEEFKKYKANTGVSHAYYSTMKRFWLPFFIQNGCNHPSEFKDFATQAETHIRTSETIHGEKFSHHTFNSFSKTLNQYMRFLLKHGYIPADRFFTVWITTTLEEKKRGQLKRKRSTDTYDLAEVIEIKRKIDKTYKDRPADKLLAYGLYLGVCTGSRQGNLLGFKAEDLRPDDEIPHFRVSDNIVRGWSRGEKGAIVFENATKTTSEEDGEILLPLLQPSREIACEVACYLKQHYDSRERVLPLSPWQVYHRWKRIARECGFKFLNPHNWKHSYATIGGEHLREWYKDTPRLLQLCCLHSSLKMTEKYIKKKYAKSLRAWASEG